MVRMYFLALVLFLTAISRAEAVTLDEVLNIPLSNAILQSFPIRDSSSPQNVFLGVTRAMATGNLLDGAWHFTDSLRFSLFGTNEMSAISNDEVELARQYPGLDLYLNNKFGSYSTEQTTNGVKFNVNFIYNRGTNIVEEILSYQMVNITNGWKIIQLPGEENE